MKILKLYFILFLFPFLAIRCDVQEPRATDWEFNDQWYKDGWDIGKKMNSIVILWIVRT
jgi:hypothetical protein